MHGLLACSEAYEFGQLGTGLSWFVACMAFLHAVRRMSLDSWALGYPGSGNMLFQRRMSSILRTNGIPERRSWVFIYLIIVMLA